MKRIIEIKKVDMVMCPKIDGMGYLSNCELCKEIVSIDEGTITCSHPEEAEQ